MRYILHLRRRNLNRKEAYPRAEGMPFESRSTAHLKHDPQPHAELPLVDSLAAEVLDARDRHEVFAITDVVVRSGEVRRIREVERLHAELQPEPVAQREFACQPEVPVEETGAPQGVE